MALKLVFSLLTIAIASAIYFIPARPGVQYDLLRRAVCREDGSLRQYSQLLLAIWTAVTLFVIWWLRGGS